MLHISRHCFHFRVHDCVFDKQQWRSGPTDAHQQRRDVVGGALVHRSINQRIARILQHSVALARILSPHVMALFDKLSKPAWQQGTHART